MSGGLLYPTRLLVLLVLIPALLSLGLAIDVSYLPALLALDAVVLAIAALDGFRALRLGRLLRAEVSAPATWSRGRVEQVTVSIDHFGGRARTIQLALDLPRSFNVGEDALQLDLVPRARATTQVKVTAQERGRFAIGGVHVALSSPMGLWRRQVLLGVEREVRVQPDLKQLGEYALLARASSRATGRRLAKRP